MKHEVQARESYPGTKVTSHDGKIVLSYVVVFGLILIALYVVSAGQVPGGTDLSNVTVFP